jgi:predicted RNA-binding Zn-ribbon protein involved in translation (DUF1610 family)
VVEDLNIAGMLKNRRLARHIAGVGMGEFRRQLDYKTTWAGGRVVVADRWYPSSKTCSACGAAKAKLRRAERTYHCDQCGLVLDRDLNAARTLAQLVDEIAATRPPRVCGATVNAPEENPTQDPHPAGSGQRAPPREDTHQPVRANVDAATRRLRTRFYTSPERLQTRADTPSRIWPNIGLTLETPIACKRGSHPQPLRAGRRAAAARAGRA